MIITSAPYSEHTGYKGWVKIGISRGQVSGTHHEPRLAPTAALLRAWQRKCITEDRFREEYVGEVLDRLNLMELITEWSEHYGNDIVFMCYEVLPDFCHRHIWMDELEAFKRDRYRGLKIIREINPETIGYLF